MPNPSTQSSGTITHDGDRSQRDLTFTETVQASSLSLPVMLAGTLLFVSYLLRMAIIPSPLSKTLTNYVAILLASVTAFVLMKKVVPLYLLGMILTLPSVFASPNLTDSGMRWIGWTMLYLAVGPVLSGSHVFRFRIFTMVIYLGFMHFSAIASGLMGLTGFQLPGGRGVFWGVLNHSNTLGFVASVAAIDSFVQWTRCRTSLAKTIWLCVFILEFTALIRAACRIALLGFFVTSFALAIVSDRRTKGKLLITAVLGLCIGLGYSVVIQNSTTAKTINQVSLITSLVEKGLENTRGELWQDRMNEFRSSPLIGLGFCMGGPMAMRVAEDGFMQEPGSSYLAALSMSGIIGMVGFFIMIEPLISATYRLLAGRYGPYPPAYVYTAAFWLVAMSTEGFSHYLGSPFCFATFLWSGVCFDSQKLFPDANPLRMQFR